MTKDKEKFDNCNCKISSFTEDRQQLQEINSPFKKLLQEVTNLKNDFAIYKQKLSKVKVVNERLRQQLNLSLYKTDALEQYGQRENLRIYNVTESNSNIDDGEEMVLHMAKEMNKNLTDMEIQRAHRLGRKRNGKPRPIIVKFMCCKKRSQFISSKKKLKDSARFSNLNVAEDLTSLRAKLLRYVKDECNNQFEQIHTKNGSILMKTSAEADESLPNERKGKWIKIDLPDDLYR